ncbi:MAG: HEAT repeat domain-containing protein [Bradymonadaceae bacterium]
MLGDLWQSGRLRLGMLEPASPSGRDAYARALAGLRKSLASLAESEDPAVAAPALGLLGRLGGAEETGLLTERLNAEASAIRAAAVRGLGQLGDPSGAIQPLVRAAEDGNFHVRRSACESLADLATTSLVDEERRQTIVELLGERLDDDYRSVRLAAVRGLGRIGGERAATLLADHLEGLDVELKAEALAALAGMDADAAKRAVKSYRDHPDYRLRRAIEGGK